MKETKKDDLIDYLEASRVTGIQIDTLYSLVSRKQIPHIRLSKRIVRFSRSKLGNWIDQASVEIKQKRVSAR
jgi:excisionase family DNA binding protein